MKILGRSSIFLSLLSCSVLFLLFSAGEVLSFQTDAQTYREQGLQFQSQRQLKQAIVCYQKAITLDPKYVVAYNDLGIIYEARGWLDKAEEVYLAGLEADSSYHNLYSNLAMLYERKGDYQSAVKFWKKRTELGEPDGVWTEKAKDRLEALLRAFPDVRQEYLKNEADELAQEVSKGKEPSALTLPRSRLSVPQRQARLYREQALDSQNEGDLKDAISCYQKAIESDPEFIKAYYELGMIYEAGGQFDKAEDVYLSGLKVDSKFMQFYTQLVKLCERKQDYDRALEFRKKKIELSQPKKQAAKPKKKEKLTLLQEEAREHRQRGLQLQGKGKFDEAASAYQKALAMDPELAVVYNDLGIIYEARGQLDRAEEMYLAGLEIDADYPNFYSNLAMLYEQKKEYKCAATFWKKRIELGQAGEAWTDKAREKLRVLSGVVPALKLRVLRQEAKELAREISVRKRVKELKDSAEVRRLLEDAKKLYQNAEYEKALNSVILALRFNPDDKEALLRLKDEINKRILEKQYQQQQDESKKRKKVPHA